LRDSHKPQPRAQAESRPTTAKAACAAVNHFVDIGEPLSGGALSGGRFSSIPATMLAIRMKTGVHTGKV